LDDTEYREYVQAQTDANKRKITRIFEYEENIEFLSNYLKKTLNRIDYGICHGTRRGKEQEWFNKNLNCNVFGTEISETAAQFPNTIQWDFHQIKSEWINHFDFIYSNSLDHSYDIPYCISQWSKCLRSNGILIINGSTTHNTFFSNNADVGGYSKKKIQEIISSIPDLNIIEIVKGKKKKIHYFSWYYVIIQKK